MANTCKWCHVDGLHWKQINGAWRLHYESGQPHTCRVTRDKIAKKVNRILTREERLLIGFTKEGVKWIMAHPPVIEMIPEDYMHPWWNWLDDVNPKPRIARNTAKQERFEEMVP